MRFSSLAPLVSLLLPLVALAAPAYRADQAPGTPEQVSQGAALFKANCASCHGEDGEGKAHWAPRLRDQAFLRAVSNDFLVATIAKGRPSTNMVSWDTTESHSAVGVKKKDVDSLVAFLRSWQTQDGVALDESPLAGSLESGQRIYDNNCKSCHGWQGSGAEGGRATVGIGHEAYLSNATDGYIRAVFGTRCKDTNKLERQAPLPEVSDYPLNYTPAQRDGVIAYLRQNAW